MPSWMAWATSSPAMRAASVSAMSMPDDTPAAVIILPCSTTRFSVGRADPVQQRVRCLERTRAEAARHHQHLRVRHRGEGLVGHQGELAVVGAIGAGRHRDEAHPGAGRRESTSYGPMASSAVMPSKSGMAMSMR
jgi:hypothetical protein